MAEPMTLSFYERLKQRSVFRVGAMYIVVSWLLLQVGDVTFDEIGLPDGSQLTLIVILAIGFPVALILAWVFDITSSGIVRTDSDVAVTDVQPLQRGRKIDYVIIGVLIMALGMTAWYQPGRDETNPTETDLAILRDDDSKLRLAVLNLRDLSQNQDLGWLAEGVSEELRQRLGTLSRFEVIPGAFLRDLAINSLDVNTRLAIDGSIKGTGSEIYIKLDVIDVQKERLLWTDDFQGKNNDPLELQQQIATAIAFVFDASLGDGSRGPTQPEAYALYLNFLYEQWGDSEADAQTLERILQLDPDWGEGWINLTIAWFRIWVQNHDESFLIKARTAAKNVDAVLEGENFSSFIEALLKAYLDGDLGGAEKVFRIMAIYADLGYTYAELMNHSGLYAEAEAYFEKLLVANPYRPNAIGAWDQIVIARVNLSNFHGALSAARSHSRLISPNNDWLQSGLPVILPKLGKLEEARELLGRAALSLEKSRKGSVRESSNRLFAHKMAFGIAMVEGDTQKARLLTEEIALYNSLSAGIRYLILNDPRAERFLSLAGETPSHWRNVWAYATAIIPPELREHPLILDLEEKLGFDKAWRLELCKRAATLPPESLITCDPGKYTL